MKQIFDQLFRAWCVSYYPELVPENLRDDPMRAYARYTFEEGVKLGMQLAVGSLEPEALAETE